MSVRILQLRHAKPARASCPRSGGTGGDGHGGTSPPRALTALTLLALAAIGAVPALAAAANASPTTELAPAPASVVIPAGQHKPLLRSTKDPVTVPVAAFALDVLPVTNAQFLAFVVAHPKWQRSRVTRLFADEHYLSHWAGDTDLGPAAPADAPVVRVSWFAARAYARWVGKRLPTTAEWERAASAGYTTPDGKNDTALNGDLYRWLARPTPEVQPGVATAKANFFGVRGLHGLVWEWVSDFNTAMVTGESRADNGLDRDLFCGAGAAGSTDTTDYAAYMRLALRSSLKAPNTTSSLGFRCAQDLAP
ncbi:MAG: formylglycine-generating enzyme family protein [Candidatus Didemnitutus sp.]|nr:formylglycine-generating enzyme family protein [Candidatus Didemnitutus sp.]